MSSSTVTDLTLLQPALHYNKNTILNKNGILLRTLEISLPDNKQNYVTLIDFIKNILHIAKFKTTDDFFFHVSIVRKKTDINLINNKKNSFAQILIDNWIKCNNVGDEDILCNKIYLTVLINNNLFSQCRIADIFFFFLSIIFSKNCLFYLKNWINLYQSLQES